MRKQASDTGDRKAKARPLYLVIFDALRAEIEKGCYQKDFPSESQLVHRFAASRQTVIQAMRELVKAGLVERHRGSGTVVSRRIRQALGCVGLVILNLEPSPFATVFAEVCKEEGYSLMYKDVALDVSGQNRLPFKTRAKAVRSLALEFVKAKVLGVLMQPVQCVADAEQINREILAVFRARRIPVVLVDHDICFPPARSGCDIVCMDNFHAGYAIGRHLLDRGAKRIALLTRKNMAPSVTERTQGLSSAVVEAGSGWNPDKNEINCRADDEKSIARFLRVFRPDAIACVNDVEAVRLLKVLAKLGVSVPDDVRVTGIDDMPKAALASPALTTVRQDFSHIAKIAARRLVWRIHNPFEPPVTIQTHGQLVIRKST